MKIKFWFSANLTKIFFYFSLFLYICTLELATFAESTWSSAQKVGVGTSYEAYDLDGNYSGFSSTAPISKTWFTIAQGILTEVYWPTVDTAQTQKTQLLIFNGKTFEEEKDGTHTIEWLDQKAPAFRITTQDKKNRFTIVKEIFSHPEKNVVFVQYEIKPYVSGLTFYLSHHPRAHNNGGNDRGEIKDSLWLAYENNHYQSLKSSFPFQKSYLESDKHVQFVGEISSSCHSRESGNPSTFENGSPAFAGDDNCERLSFTLALGFGYSSQEAIEIVKNTHTEDIQKLKKQYIEEWKSYFQKILNLAFLTKDNGKHFYSSVIALKTHEDKTHEGAIVASLSIPWGDTSIASVKGENFEISKFLPSIDSVSTRGTGGYHLVWPRDLFHIARAFMSIHDDETAKNILNYFKSIQFSEKDGFWYFGPRVIPKKGAFPQNIWVDGTSFWGGLQMDQVSFPIILTWHLWKKGMITLEHYWNMVKDAAHLIATTGPWTHQERWEENYGISPSTVAAEISALICAADMAEAYGKSDEASFWLSTADRWSLKKDDNIEAWTFTRSGILGNGKYYLRLDGSSRFSEHEPDYFALWNPNDTKKISLANLSGTYLEKEIVDGGFLELVRYGVRSPTNEFILDSLPEMDEKIKVQTPQGSAWYRYLHDGYGEEGRGRLWIFLTAERAQYELALLLKRQTNPKVIIQVLDEYIQTLETFSNEGGFFPEQIWDKGEKIGKPTGSATPLLWTHAEYLKLLSSKADLKPFDLLPIVYDRYKHY